MTKMLGQAAIVGVLAFAIALAALSLWHTRSNNVTDASRQASHLADSRNAAQDEKNIWEKTSTVTNVLLAIIAVVQIFLVLNANESARISANAAVRAADTSTQANNLSRQSLIADQRPWIAVSFEPAGPITWSAGGLQVSYKVTLKNIGKSPALNLKHIQGVTLPFDADLLAEQATLRRLIAANNTGAINLMPGEEIQLIGHIQKTRDEVTRSAAAWGGDGPKLIQPVLVGAADYKTSFDDDIRTTGFIYEVGFWDPTKGITVTAMDPLADGDIPPERVRIRRRPNIDAQVN